ncbi:hypothetical protein BDZ89DRAFT_1158023 [Hymenopellis radicata]|nr:hypothetical protein BDZ89DRAFT_1158023 [Hymenopellis radicata]
MGSSLRRVLSSHHIGVFLLPSCHSDLLVISQAVITTCCPLSLCIVSASSIPLAIMFGVSVSSSHRFDMLVVFITTRPLSPATCCLYRLSYWRVRLPQVLF